MSKLLLLAVVLSAFVSADAGAQHPGYCDCYGGWDPDLSPSYWYLLDFFGYPLEDGDWVYAAWTGPDGEVDAPDENGYPAGDDSLLLYQSMNYIEYGMFFVVVTTFPPGDGRRPMSGDLIYCRIFDGPEGAITLGNYYGDSQTYEVQWVYPPYGEEFLCFFPGDPGGGHTDTPVPEGEVPVGLMSFKALGRDGQVLLEWRTASEADNLGFHIERSADLTTFQRITGRIIAGAGDSETEKVYAYVDKGLTNRTTYYYNLITVGSDGTERQANEAPVSATPAAQVPTEFLLGQNYPNPFNPVTEITYTLPRDVYATLVEADQKAGFYTARWDAAGLSSGVYFCALTAGECNRTIKMVLMK
jgi:hypothetical protein